MRYVVAILVLLLVTPASAGLSRSELASVSAALPPGAHLDPRISALDAKGRRRTLGELLAGHSIFFNFVDYTCNTLCGTDLELLAAGIARAHLDPSDYRIVVFGIDPRDSARDAIAMAHKEIPAALLPQTVLLLPDKAMVARTTKALGFHYVYDAGTDQFAHPAAVYVVGADGAIRGVLSPFALTATDMKAVFEASTPAPTLYDRVRLLCYGYDPATGIYSLRIVSILRIACIVMVLLLGSAIFLLIRRGRAA